MIPPVMRDARQATEISCSPVSFSIIWAIPRCQLVHTMAPCVVHMQYIVLMMVFYNVWCGAHAFRGDVIISSFSLPALSYVSSAGLTQSACGPPHSCGFVLCFASLHS